MNRLEITIASLIGIILFYILIPREKPEVQEEILEEIPVIEAWIDTHEKWDGTDGDIVKIKFMVENRNTKLWVKDLAGNIVHKTPFSVDPYPEDSNKPIKIYNYVWKLYKSQRSREILPGKYEIIVGTNLNSTNNYYLDFEIL